ncbi:peptidoglycan glycosyltransferase [Anaerotaenia torta]|uniref:peptidoglycan D,D-transpeptidase FtsI family protein n=1 Tax=Anaerotaenia torta TaxID=433293 RepID=UPI003D22358C
MKRWKEAVKKIAAAWTKYFSEKRAGELAAARETQEASGPQDVRKPIFSILYIFLGIFVLIAGYFSYYLIIRSDDVINNAYNRRQEVLEQRVIRGSILSADGEILAQTLVDGEGKETREYPFKKVFAHVVGRYSKGKSGIEEMENIRLLTSNINSIEVMYSDLMGEKSQGDNVITTLDSKLQKLAYDALGDNRGAVVVLEVATGRILAMVSKPSYDPNLVDQEWETILEDEDKKAPLLNRATQGLYAPGSTFKVLTALEYMRENMTYLEYEYDCDGAIEYEDEYGEMVIHCHFSKAHGKLSLPMALAKSCNTSFANIGMSLDLTKFHALCEDFLFNRNIPVRMAASVSQFSLQKGVSGTKEAMQTAIGQGQTLISPLHSAMIAATIANDGMMMKPYVVERIENAEGAVVKEYSPDKIGRKMSGSEAEYLTKAMRLVVTKGTATKLSDLKVAVAGKTGSADNPAGKAHSWFIGFAPEKDSEIAVSVIVENVGTGSEYAVPIAKEIFQEYYKKK